MGRMFVAVEGPKLVVEAGWCAEHQKALDQTRSRATRGAQARSERRGVPPTFVRRGAREKRAAETQAVLYMCMYK